ncbi:MAG: hypothetical protein KGK30_01780, partial [Elusimicrobia bacterium]|nr:hypothetical protein [Elusimicrobiota bacterium]
MFFLLAAAALLTAFYMTRLIMLTFLGAPREEELHQHAHESPASMTGPMMLLASLAVVSGMALAHAGFIERLLPLSAAAPAEELAAREFPEWLGAGVSVLGALSIVLGFLLYRGPAFETAKALKRRFSGLFELLENRYGFDAFFLRLVEAADALSRFCFWFDSQVVDRVFVDGWGLLTLIWAEAAQLVDSRLIDRTVDGFGLLSLDLGGGLRALVRDGQVQEYLMYVAIVVSLFAALLLMR